MAGRPDFPRLSVEASFPYRPVFADETAARVKKPDWLNDPTLYHNRGEATEYAGEQLLFGDFFGLDDLMTESSGNSAPGSRDRGHHRGKRDFFIFGEVYSADPGLTSHYAAAGRMQSVLDFPFQDAARRFVAGQGASTLAAVLEEDDLYTEGFAGVGADAEGRQDMFPTRVPDHLDQDQVGTDRTPAQDDFDPRTRCTGRSRR